MNIETRIGSAQPLATPTPFSANNQRNLLRNGMRKLFLIYAIIVLVAGGSAQAQQKPVDYIGPPVPFDQTISIEDDATGNFLVFSTGNGKYMFTRCSDGFTIGGVGVVKVDGCSISITDVQGGHRMVATVNECAQEGRALVEKFDAAAFKVTFGDQKMGDNLMNCTPKK